jgi:acylglycerol lipase
VRNDPRITARDGKVYINKPAEKGSADSSKSAHSPLHSTTGTAWVAYQVWIDQEAAERTGRNADLVYAHGINDYGGVRARLHFTSDCLTSR